MIVVKMGWQNVPGIYSLVVRSVEVKWLDLTLCAPLAWEKEQLRDKGILRNPNCSTSLRSCQREGLIL